jgi:hypothetical protein
MIQCKIYINCENMNHLYDEIKIVFMEIYKINLPNLIFDLILRLQFNILMKR